MKIYPVPPPATNTTASQDISRVLFRASVFSIASFTLSSLLNFLHQVHRRPSITTSLIVGIGFGLTSFWIARGARKSSSFWYEIVVTDREIRGVTPTSLRTVRKGQIRTISERNSGVLVSERARLGLVLGDGLWIPKALPEYEYLRALIEGWRVAS
jgi:hypothetical protein